MPYAIETVNLTKYFTPTPGLGRLLAHPFRKREVVKAVEDVNIQVKRGEIFGLLGPNGAGKTTLLKLLSTLILPTRGEAYVNGYNILKEEAGVKESIGLVTGEERSFYWRLTGRQNLRFFAILYNLSSTQIKRRIGEVAELLEIEGMLNISFKEYSTGMKQRLSLARSLLPNPQILFMDEPTKSLDPIAAKNLRSFIREKLVSQEKRTVFLTTHQMNEAQEICDRLAIIDKGKIKACGTLTELRKEAGLPGADLEKIFAHFTGK